MGQRGPQPGRPEMSLRGDPERQRVFVESVRATGNLREAARQASPHSSEGCMTTFKAYMRDSPEFAARCGDALEDFRESLIKAAVTRGRDGYDRPIFQKGELVGHEKVYSDNLLLAELKKHFPKDYSEKHDHRHSVVISPSGAWQITLEDLAHLSQSEKQALAALMDRVREGRGEERRAIKHMPTVEVEFEEVAETEFCEFDLGEIAG